MHRIYRIAAAGGKVLAGKKADGTADGEGGRSDCPAIPQFAERFRLSIAGSNDQRSLAHLREAKSCENMDVAFDGISESAQALNELSIVMRIVSGDELP